MALSMGFKNISFPPSCHSSYGVLDFYPGGTLTHCSCQPSLDAHLSGVIWPNPLECRIWPRTVSLFEGLLSTADIAGLWFYLWNLKQNGSNEHRGGLSEGVPSANSRTLSPQFRANHPIR